MTPSITGTISIGNSQSPLVANVLTLPSHTVPADARVLFVVVFFDTFFNHTPIVTWNGIDIPFYFDPDLGGVRCNIFRLDDPTPGTGSVVVSTSLSGSTTVAAAAFSLTDFGQVHFVEQSWKFSFDATQDRLETSVYARDTDLVLDFIDVYTDSSSATPDAGQTILAYDLEHTGGRADGSGCQMAISQKDTPTDAGIPVNPANSTLMAWTTSTQQFNTANDSVVMVFRSLDPDPPAGAPIYIDCVTDIMSLQTQPDEVTGHRWRHRVPESHPNLAVITSNTGAADALDVFWQADGEDEIALTELVQSGNAGVFSLEDVPVPGEGWLRVLMNANTRYGATAVSYSGTGIHADVFRGGIDPNYMRISTTPGEIVVDRIADTAATVKVFNPVTGTALHASAIVGSANVRTSTTGADQASASWTTAVGVLTEMAWEESLEHQGGFAFTPIEPEEPEEPPPPVLIGCPTIDEMTPSDPAVDACASIDDMSVSEPLS